MLSGDTPEVEIIFDQVVAIEDPNAQRLLLDRLCGTDLILRERVEGLLRAYSKSQYLERPLSIIAPGALHPPLIGQTVDGYEVLDIIGDGGMGEVYLARDRNSPKLLVALKVIKLGMDSRQILARFELEKLVLRRLEHPAISRYFDAGYTADGRAYFSMELVRGLPITEYCDRHSLPIEQRVMLLHEVCLAIEHAHQNGIVHRDLKPCHILVSQENGQPLPKIIDFGIAKALTPDRPIDTRFTHPLQFLGTPAYTSPEQLRCSSDVDGRTDVYSLGAVLFELLAGSPPVVIQPSDVLNAGTMHLASMKDDLATPSGRVSKLSNDESALVAKQRGVSKRELVGRLRRNLDWVVLKAMEKDRRLRYASARELASDLTASLEERPTQARGPTRIESLQKWAVRHSRAIGRIAAGLAVLAAVVVFWSANRAAQRTQTELAVSLQSQGQELSALTYKEFSSDLQQVAEALQHGSDRAAQAILDRYHPSTQPPGYDHFAFRYLQSLMVKSSIVPVRHGADLLDLDVSPDERWLVTSDRGGDIVITDLHAEKEIHRLHPASSEVTRVRFSPDGQLLASVGQDRKLRLWKTGSWEALKTLSWHELTINGLAWSPSGEHLVTGDRAGHVCIWEVSKGEVIHRLPKHHGHVRTIAWSPDGKHLATADGEVGVNLWSTLDWSLRGEIDSKKQGILSLAFSPDNRYLALGGYIHELMMVDVSNMEAQRLLLDSYGGPWSLAFGKEGELLAGLGDGSLRYFEVSRSTETWTQRREIELASIGSNLRRVKSLSHRPEWIVGSEQTREVMRLPIPSIRGYRTWDWGMQFVGCLPELQVLIGSHSSDGTAAVYDADSGELLQQLNVHALPHCRPCFNSKAGLVAISGRDEQGFCVNLYNSSDWSLRTRIPSSGRVNQLSISRDGSNVVLCCGPTTDPQNETSVYDLVTGDWRNLNEHFGGTSTTAVFSPSSDLLVYGMRAGRRLVCLDANTLELVAAAELDSDLYCLHSPPAAPWVLVGQANHLSCYSPDLKNQLWSSPSPSTIIAIETSPDNRIAACFHADGQVRLWDLQSQKLLYALPYEVSESHETRLSYWVSFIEPTRLVFGGMENPSAIEFRADAH